MVWEERASPNAESGLATRQADGRGREAGRALCRRNRCGQPPQGYGGRAARQGGGGAPARERKSVVEQHKINLGGYDDDDDMGGDSADDMGEESGEEYEESEEEEEASEDLAIAPTELVRHFIDSMEANARGRKGSQLDATCAIAPLLGVISSDHEPPLTLRAAKCLCRLIRNNVGNRLARARGRRCWHLRDAP